MKKILSIVLVAMLAVCMLAGCGNGGDNKLTMSTNATFPPYEFQVL